MDTKAMLSVLLPRAIEWCTGIARQAASTGVPLKQTAFEDARALGVRYPEKVRVLVVDHFPLPSDVLLRSGAASLGFLGSNTAGLALGYSVLVRRGRLSRKLLSHELRHVSQFEERGSLAAFLTAYLEDIVAAGYEDCWFERDAREHELANADLRWRPI